MLNLGTLIAKWLDDSPHKDEWIIGDQDQTFSILQLKVLGEVDLKEIPHFIINSTESTVKQCCAPPPKGVNLRAEDPEFFAKLERILTDAASVFETYESESD